MTLTVSDNMNSDGKDSNYAAATTNPPPPRPPALGDEAARDRELMEITNAIINSIRQPQKPMQEKSSYNIPPPHAIPNDPSSKASLSSLSVSSSRLSVEPTTTTLMTIPSPILAHDQHQPSRTLSSTSTSASTSTSTSAPSNNNANQLALLTEKVNNLKRRLSDRDSEIASLRQSVVETEQHALDERRQARREVERAVESAQAECRRAHEAHVRQLQIQHQKELDEARAEAERRAEVDREWRRGVEERMRMIGSQFQAEYRAFLHTIDTSSAPSTAASNSSTSISTSSLSRSSTSAFFDCVRQTIHDLHASSLLVRDQVSELRALRSKCARMEEVKNVGSNIVREVAGIVDGVERDCCLMQVEHNQGDGDSGAALSSSMHMSRNGHRSAHTRRFDDLMKRMHEIEQRIHDSARNQPSASAESCSTSAPSSSSSLSSSLVNSMSSHPSDSHARPHHSYESESASKQDADEDDETENKSQYITDEYHAAPSHHHQQQQHERRHPPSYTSHPSDYAAAAAARSSRSHTSRTPMTRGNTTVASAPTSPYSSRHESARKRVQFDLPVPNSALR